jgi:hypothetical protein
MKVCFVALRNQEFDLYQLETISLKIESIGTLPQSELKSGEPENIDSKANAPTGTNNKTLTSLDGNRNQYFLRVKSKNPSFLIPWSCIRSVRITNSLNKTILEKTVEYDALVGLDTLETMTFGSGDVILGFTVGKYAVLHENNREAQELSSRLAQDTIKVSSTQLAPGVSRSSTQLAPGVSRSSIQLAQGVSISSTQSAHRMLQTGRDSVASVQRSTQIQTTSAVLKTANLLKKSCTKQQFNHLFQLLKTNTTTKDINLDLKIMKEKIKNNRKTIESLQLLTKLKNESIKKLEIKITEKLSNLDLLVFERISGVRKLQENRSCLEVLKASLQQEYASIVRLQRLRVLQLVDIYPIRVEYSGNGLFGTATREAGRDSRNGLFGTATREAGRDSGNGLFGTATREAGTRDRAARYCIKDVGTEKRDAYYGMFSELLILTCFYLYIPIKYPIIAKGKLNRPLCVGTCNHKSCNCFHRILFNFSAPKLIGWIHLHTPS